MKTYRLLGVDGRIYESESPGQYEQHRVFFADERTALAAGYRPCGNCLRQKYKDYKEDPAKYKAKFGL